MGMSRFACIGGLALALAACGGEQKQEKAAEEVPATLAAGLYEVTSEVTALASTDNTTPAIKVKQGDKFAAKACVAPDGKPAPELLADAAGDKCEIKNSYIRNGRMSAQMSCVRAGKNGPVMPAMIGSFTADSFEGEVSSLTYFPDDGDYRMTRKISAKRVGDCPAAPAETKPA